MKITYIIPTKNRPDTLVRAIKSIQKNSCESRIIVVNDGGDKKSLQKALDNIENTNIKIISNEISKGAPYSRNIGASYAKTEILSFLDDDDEILHSKQILSEIMAKDSVDLAYGKAVVVGKNGIKKGEVGCNINYLSVVNPIPSPSFIIRKKAFDAINGYTLGAKSCQDWDLYIKLANNGAEMKFLDSSVAIHYDHDGERISNNLMKYYIGRFGLLTRNNSFFIKRNGYLYFVKSLVKVLLRRFP